MERKKYLVSLVLIFLCRTGWNKLH